MFCCITSDNSELNAKKFDFEQWLPIQVESKTTTTWRALVNDENKGRIKFNIASADNYVNNLPLMVSLV